MRVFPLPQRQIARALSVTGLLVICHPFDRAAVAQQALPLVRRAAVATPRVADVRVVRQQAVEVAPVALGDLQRSPALQLDLFPDVSFRALRTRAAPTGHGMSWVGVLDGYPGSAAVFAMVGDELVGHLYAPFGFFRIQRGDSGYLVQQVEPGPGEDDVVADPGPWPRETDASRAMSREERVGTLAHPDDSGALIDVMVIYTRSALEGFGSEARTLATIDLLVTQTNEALRNSRISSNLRLVHAGVIDYEESGDFSIDLDRLWARSDGFLDDVHALRDRYAADLVVLVTEKLQGTVEGAAFLNGPPSTGSGGFSVIQRSGTQNGRTFSHEIGHNLGLQHDWYVTSSPGAFSYSKGYVSLPGRFLDLMAYWNLCIDRQVRCSQLLCYSNSTIERDGHAQGVRPGTNVTCRAWDYSSQVECDADSAATLAIMAPVVARFRNSRTSLAARQILPGAGVPSDNGWFRLVYQPDGNLVLIDTRSGATVWAANTGGTVPGQVIMQTDGNLIVYDAAGAARWTSNTSGNPNAYFLVQNDGNFVIHRADGQPVWGTK
jgi:hypothetical protein